MVLLAAGGANDPPKIPFRQTKTTKQAPAATIALLS
jgi:hypothetical protein